MRPILNAVGLALVLTAVGPCLLLSDAQPPDAAEEQLRRTVLPGEGRDALVRLAAPDRLAARGAWADALDEYQRLIGDGGDDLVPEDAPRERLHSTRRSVQLRRLCHVRIAALPAAALRLYRGRVDPRAKKWFHEGLDGHDTHALRRVVDEAFCSRVGDRAADLLGDLAFEKGNFAEARRWWSLIVPPSGEPAQGPGRLLFPDPEVEVAKVRAKQVIALLFRGEGDRAARELEAFRRLHGAASGRLAGRTGNYAAAVQALLDERRRGPLAPEEGHWPTFAGDPSRNRALPEALSDRLWANGPAWRVPLAVEGEGGEARTERRPTARRLAFHPVIAGGRVLVADTRHVTGYDLHTGRRLFRYDLLADDARRDSEGLRFDPAAVPDLRCTLSVADGRVYARLGAPTIAPPARREAPRGGYLVCLDLPAPGAAKDATERWVVKPAVGPGGPYAFEGAPLVHDGRVYVAESCLAGGRTRTAIACRDADDGALLWRRHVCETPHPDEEPPPRFRHHLLTLAGAAVVYCTHVGAVVAVDALTGRRLWGVRYPSTAGGESPRDLAPCVAVDQQLFVAPQDSPRLLCLDVETGRTLWEREGIEAVHLLGVSEGRLVLTTASGIRALDAATGADEGGWRQPAFGKRSAFGRGLLAGGWVLWPTDDAALPLRALNVDDGSQERGRATIDPTRLRRLQVGNMAFGEGCLVVADGEELVGYAPRRK